MNPKDNLKIYNKAFSLVEISVVILVIGILIAGISKGVDLYQDHQLNIAQNLTRNSIVNRIGDLVAWYETSLPSSFDANEAKINNGYITKWNDNNTLSIYKNNATAGTPLNTGNQPIIVKNAFNNSIPGLRFSRSQFLNYNPTSLIKSNYAIFVVEQRRGSGSNWFLGGTSTSTGSNLHLGYQSNTVLVQSHYNPDLYVTVSAYARPTPIIHTFLFSTNNGLSYSMNGVVKAADSTKTNPITSYSNPKIGSVVNIHFYNGDFAEIIMFKKSLQLTEIKAIESYLGIKHGIAVAK